MKRIKISTDNLEVALGQIVRAKTTRTKASINNAFVSSLLKELIDRRKEDEENCEIIQAMFFETEPLLKGKPRIVVEEVSNLTDLGNTSWTSADADAPTHADTRCLDAFIVKTPRTPTAPKARKPSLSSGVRARAKVSGGSSKRWLVVALVLVIVLTFSQVMLSFSD